MTVYNIPATVSFVDALAQGLLERAGGDPLKLAEMTVLLPNRRACRNLREAFLRKSNGAPLLLPAIRPIGDVDEDALSLGPGMETLENQTPVDPLRRQLILAQYLNKVDPDRYTMAQALPMAADLGRFLDRMHTEGLTLKGLDDLVPEKYAAHWQETLIFLKKIVGVYWPRQLEKENALDPGHYRRVMIEAYTQTLKNNPPAGPIFAAGSTGSIPATAALLKTVASLPNGAVVLPGLDLHLDDESWQLLEEGHPQSGLAHLLLSMDLTRKDVKNWDGTGKTSREDLISTLMRPAATLQAWTDHPVPAAAFENLTLLEADTLDAEAASIAAVMRTHAQDTAATDPCVLVTPDRVLATRVGDMLKRWNILIDDSAGIPLNRTPVGAWILLLCDVLNESLAPVPLLALIKSGFAAGGNQWPKDAPPFRTFVRALDLHVLRGTRPQAGFNGLLDRISDIADDNMRKSLHAGMRAVEKLFAPIVIAASTADRLRALILLAENLAATNDTPGAHRLWAGDAGEAAAKIIADLLAQSDVLPELDWEGLRFVLDAAMQPVSVRPRFGTHPRLAILGPIEARLYQAKTMILGSLNEGTWPRLAEVDGWMSRDMRAKFGLPAPERAITLTAHDFCQGMGASNVILTRSKNRDGAPTVPSRWLQRLDAVMQASNAPDIRAAGERWLSIASQLDAPIGKSTPVGRPEFSPPLESRPTSLRVTEISKLRADPYGIYAKYVLGLSPLDPIDAEPDHRDRGTLIHTALEHYTRAFPKDLPRDALKQFIAIGKKIFAEAHAHPDVHGHWWPRFVRMAGALIAFEMGWRNNTVQAWAEADAKMDMPIGPENKRATFTLRGRADRIEHRTDGWAIIDYKSGGAPGAGEVKSGDEPQLTLLGAMLLAGAFNDSLKTVHTPDTIATLAYWPAGGNSDTFAPQTIKDKDLNALAAEAKSGLADIITAYLVDGIPYICWPDADKKLRDDYEYAHLGRIAEWAGDDDTEEAA